MLANVLILVAASLATVAHGAALLGTQADNASPALLPLRADIDDGPTARNISARTTANPAVQWTEFENRECGGWSVNYQIPDDGCYTLPNGNGFDIRGFASTCRAFIYASNSCSGAEVQVYDGNCYDVHSFWSIKAFCQ